MIHAVAYVCTAQYVLCALCFALQADVFDASTAKRFSVGPTCSSYAIHQLLSGATTSCEYRNELIVLVLHICPRVCLAEYDDSYACYVCLRDVA
jgi:hypothetical protein